MIFDTHAHYDDKAFDADRTQMLASLAEAGIGRVVDVGSTIESNAQVLALANAWPQVYAALGVHPSECGQLTDEILYHLEKQIAANRYASGAGDLAADASQPGMAADALHPETNAGKVVAVGEIGLDYYWDDVDRETQKKWFIAQLEMAKRLDLPVVIHSREAAEDTFHIMKKYHAGTTGGVIHCYSYSAEMAKEYVKLGYFIGVGGVLTFKNARKLKETVAQIPAESIVLETDCPYLAPVPHRGERNCSAYLPLVVKAAAELKELPEEKIERITWENAKRLYRMTD